MEEIFPKPTAHSQQSVFLSVSGKKQLEMRRGAEGVVFLKEKYIYIYLPDTSGIDVTQQSLLFHSRYLLL